MSMDKVLARVFADGDSEAPAEFLNALGESMWNSCRRDDNAFDSQCCYVESSLNEHGKRFARVLGSFCGDE